MYSITFQKHTGKGCFELYFEGYFEFYFELYFEGYFELYFELYFEGYFELYFGVITFAISL
jgi:hypothetical protein